MMIFQNFSLPLPQVVTVKKNFGNGKETLCSNALPIMHMKSACTQVFLDSSNPLRKTKNLWVHMNLEYFITVTVKRFNLCDITDMTTCL